MDVQSFSMVRGAGTAAVRVTPTITKLTRGEFRATGQSIDEQAGNL
jgi:hypothetical protein